MLKSRFYELAAPIFRISGWSKHVEDAQSEEATEENGFKLQEILHIKFYFETGEFLNVMAFTTSTPTLNKLKWQIFPNYYQI